MDQIFSALDEIRQINQEVDISTERIDELEAEMREARVCTPVIGKFSSGKSALINSLLGYKEKMLREDITPETAIPAEVVYSDLEEQVIILKMDGSEERFPVACYRDYKADAATVKCARIQLTNSFLQSISDVMLVDMPGFESGLEIHNKAIDEYLPRSMAYLVTFPADDMIVRKSVGDILKELCVYDMPLCVVITKKDKENDEFSQTFEKLKENLRRYVGDREIRYCITSSRDGNVEELKWYLERIQEESQEILAKKYSRMLQPILNQTETYLKSMLHDSQLSESELAEKEEEYQKQFSTLDVRFSEERSVFEKEIAECICEIKSDLRRTLEREEATLTIMVMNRQSINGHLNTVVRNAVAVSVKNRLIPRIEKYMRRMEKAVNMDCVGDVQIACSFDIGNLNRGIAGGVVAAVGSLILGLPLLTLGSVIITIIRNSKNREEAKQKIRMKLEDEVFPQILQDVGEKIEMEVMKQSALVNTSIQREVKEQQSALEKALTDIQRQMQEEKETKEYLVQNIRASLERIDEIRDGL